MDKLSSCPEHPKNAATARCVGCSDKLVCFDCGSHGIGDAMCHYCRFATKYEKENHVHPIDEWEYAAVPCCPCFVIYSLVNWYENKDRDYEQEIKEAYAAKYPKRD